MAGLVLVTIPDAEELTRRLTEIEDEPYLVHNFYPLLMPLAGQAQTGEGIVMALSLAAGDYAQDLPPLALSTLLMKLHQFLPAFTSDDEVLASARRLLKASGLPTG